MSIEERISPESSLRTSVNTELEVEPEVISSGTFLLKEGIISSCNYKFSDLLGYKVDDIVNKLSLSDILETNDYVRIKLKISQLVLSDNESLTETVQIKTSKQKLLKVGLVLSKTQSENKPALICSVFNQYDERDENKHLDYLTDLLNGLNQNAVLTDINGKIIFVSTALTFLLGYNEDDIIGKNFKIFFESCPNKTNFNDIVSLLEENSHSKEIIICKKDGSHILIDLTYSKIKDMNTFPKYLLFNFRDITEKDRVLGKLRRDEFKYRNLFNKMKFAFALMKITSSAEKESNDLKIVEVNNAFAELVKVPAADLVGQFASETFPKYLTDLITEIINLFNVKTPGDSEQRFEYFAEEINKWFSITVYLSENEYATILIHDVTREKIAEKKVHDANNMLRTILDNIPQRVFWKDNHSNFLGCNIHFANDYGFANPEEIIGKSEYDIQNEETAKHYIKTDKRVIETGKSIRISECEQYITSKNNEIWVRLNKVPLKDENNHVYGVVATYEDISKQRSDEENLRKLSQAVEQSPASIVITDLRGRIEYVNSKFCTVTGFSFPEVQGKNCRILKSGEMSSEDYKILWEQITSGKEWTGEFHNKKKNGELFWESASISPIKDSNGKITHYLAVKEDITAHKEFEIELKRAKEKAEEMSRLKSIFLANISHELRTPLIGILGYAETLFNELEIPEFKEMAYTLLKSGGRLKDTLNLILDLSHIEADKISVALIPNNLSKLVLEKLKQFHLVAKDKNIRLRILLGNEDMIIAADTRMLSQVIEHLLSNAIKYTNQGEVVISLTREKENQNEFAVLKIADTGIGISAENVKLIFEPFRQASEGLSRSFEGVGLGLTVAKKFIELMNGSIFVKSELDKGSEFTIKFPIHHSKFITALKQNSNGIEDYANQLQYKYPDKVLLVEDDEPTANITRFYLSSICKTDWAKNGTEAIRMAEKEHYSVILADINLGAGMSGIDAVAQIKKINGYQNVIVVAVTAYALYGDKEKFLSQGCDFYISKPFNKNELLKLMDKVLAE